MLMEELCNYEAEQEEVTGERKTKIILTGDRPTGQLHLGHYFGTLKNRINLQNSYDCLFIIADLQVLTDHPENHVNIEKNVFEVMCDYLGVGLNPSNTFFVQSQVPELTELSMYFSFLVSISSLKQNPTIKEEAKKYAVKNMSLGFLGYPVSQAADILAFKADLVPVGKDQVPHIQQAREIAKSFNRVFGRRVFNLPEALVGECPVLVGTDGENKMSKSLDNFIAFAHSPEETERRILNMVTDRTRIRASDPGHPDECSAFAYWKLFAFSDDLSNIRQDCEMSKYGCRECKKHLALKINQYLKEIRELRECYVSQPDVVWDILSRGTERARTIASQTLEEAREAIKITFPKIKENRYKQ